MKNGLITFGVIGLLACSVVLMAKGPAEDQAVAAAVVDNLQVDDLAGAEQEPGSSGPPDLTPAVVQAVLEDLKDPEANGGLLKIARKHGCSMAQVKIIAAERDRRLRDLAEAQAEPIE